MPDYKPPKMKLGPANLPIKFRPLKSKRFCCAMCFDFVIEHTPVVTKEMIDSYIRVYGIPEVKLECPRGCSRSKYWSFYDINDPATRKRY